MKRIIILVICISFCSYAMADSVTPQQAANKAESFFSGGIRTKSRSSVKLVWTWPEVQTKVSNGSDPLLYVFERDGGGFAIVAGEDAAHPILGYSATGSFSTIDMPDNLRSFLNWYGDVLQCARDNHWPASSETREEWEAGMTLADLDNEQSVQLETARWGQRSPYNDVCPEIDGVRCPSGCVATATAIIMRYHQWPKRGTGELPSYDYDYKGGKRHVEGHGLGHEYQWDNMPMKMPEGGYTNEQSKQIAQLLYDVGVACKMGYTPYGSSSFDFLAAKGLLQFFDYDYSMRIKSRPHGFSFSDWESIIIREIDGKRPVLYSGESDDGSNHALVIDGYRDCFFSFNFGWGGAYNGLFLLTPIDEAKDEMVEYYKRQTIVYNIRQNNNTNKDFYSLYSAEECAFLWDYIHDASFTTQIMVGSINIVDSISICVGHVDKKGQLLEIVSTPQIIKPIEERNEGNHYIHDERIINFKVFIDKDKVQDGDQLRVFYWSEEEEQWLIVESPREGYVVFDRHTPLSDLVSFGLSYLTDEEINRPTKSGDTFRSHFLSNYPSIAQKESIQLRAPQGVYCYLQRETSNGTNMTNILNGPGGSKLSVEEGNLTTIFPESPSSDGLLYISYRFWLQPGNYRLVLKKFDEEMTIRFKL